MGNHEHTKTGASHGLLSPSMVPGTAAAKARGLVLATQVPVICQEILVKAGPMAALRFLNARTRYRFTGLYRVDSSLLRTVHLYDRENPTLSLSGDVAPIAATYCAIVADDNRAFATGDSRNDARLENHAARERVLSYCGVPIRGSDDGVWGTLCHYDVRPRLLLDTESYVLEAVAPLFAECVTRDD